MVREKNIKQQKLINVCDSQINNGKGNNKPSPVPKTGNGKVHLHTWGNAEITQTHYLLEEGLLERGFNLKEDFANGNSNEIRINDAHIFYNDYELLKTRVLDKEITTPVMQMYFLLAGENKVTDNNSNLGAISQNRHNVFYRSSFQGQYHLLGNKFENFGIQLTEKFFNRLLDQNSKTLDNILIGIANKSNDIQLSNENLPITPVMKSIIYDMKNNKRTGHMKRLFLESKIIELFMLQVEQAEFSNNGIVDKYRKEDIDKLYDARTYVEDNVLTEFTLFNLSREIGLNDFKLKKGFKELFGTTVFGYLNELKMNYAKRLLLDEKKTISETSLILGYSAAPFLRRI